MKVIIRVRPTGLYNGSEWPAVGEEIDLPDHVAVGMLKAKQVRAIPDANVVEAAIASANAETATVQTGRRNARDIAAQASASKDDGKSDEKDDDKASKGTKE